MISEEVRIRETKISDLERSYSMLKLEYERICNIKKE